MFASLFIWILATVIALRFENLLEIPLFVYAIPLVLGVILGYIGSCVGLNKFMR